MNKIILKQTHGLETLLLPRDWENIEATGCTTMLETMETQTDCQGRFDKKQQFCFTEISLKKIL